MAETGSRRAAISEALLRELLVDNKKIALVAQPIVDLRRGQVVGYEALSRFSLGVPSPPDHVFAEAARHGLAEQLEAKVVQRALDLAQNRPPNCFFTLNIDPRHLTSTLVQTVLMGWSDLRGVVFELTEHNVIDDFVGVRAALSELRKRGAMLAIDDAGSGYSGLKQILELRPQLLKVDRELITHVHEDEAKRALIQMLGDLAGELDAWLLAEGIETEAELQALCQLRVPLGQGYFLGRPAPPWAELSPQVSDYLGSFPRSLRHGGTISSLVESCALCNFDAPWPLHERLCIRIEQDKRPLAMRLNDSFGERIREDHELMKVKREGLLPDVARRAATRSEALRWDPLLCIDEQGKLEGVVRMQRILTSLADMGDELRARLQ